MNKLLDWIKNKLGITQLKYDNDLIWKQLEWHIDYVKDKVAELQAYTRVDADVGFRGNNTIILTGVYRKTAYVRFFDIGDGEFEGLVNQMNEMRGHSLIRHVDAPPSFHGIFKL